MNNVRWFICFVVGNLLIGFVVGRVSAADDFFDALFVCALASAVYTTGLTWFLLAFRKLKRVSP